MGGAVTPLCIFGGFVGIDIDETEVGDGVGQRLLVADRSSWPPCDGGVGVGVGMPLLVRGRFQSWGILLYATAAAAAAEYTTVKTKQHRKNGT